MGNMKAKGGPDLRPWLLDLGSGAGVGADGYVRAGFRVRCVDNNPRALEHWWGEAWCEDMMEVLADEARVRQHQAIHASPPCQRFTAARELARAQGKGESDKTVDLLTPVLEVLTTKYEDVPWVVENVPRSPLAQEAGVVQLCGSAFELQVQRHRLFLSNGPLEGVACDHNQFPMDEERGKPRPWGVYYALGDDIPSGGRTARTLEHAMEVMGVGRRVPWEFLKEGLPPAYTEHIGQQMMEWVTDG